MHGGFGNLGGQHLPANEEDAGPSRREQDWAAWQHWKSSDHPDGMGYAEPKERCSGPDRGLCRYPGQMRNDGDGCEGKKLLEHIQVRSIGSMDPGHVHCQVGRTLRRLWPRRRVHANHEGYPERARKKSY